MKEQEKKRITFKSWILYGMLLSVAIVFGYVEAVVSPTIIVPGIKIGLPNIVTLLLLFTEKRIWPAFTVGLLRTIIISALFGNLAMIMYSAGGFVISFYGMLLFYKLLHLRMLFVSIAGGILHNTTQLCIAVLVLSSKALFVELPVLFAAGVIAGGLTGIVGIILSKNFKTLYIRFNE